MSDKFSDEVREGSHVCGFCSTNSHDLCKGMIRNGDLSLYKCPCVCFTKKTERCTECFTKEKEHLTRPWLCGDREACYNRIMERLSDSPSYRKIVELQGRIANLKETKPTPKPKTNNTCKCCGEPTRGGNFLPGHDSRWLTGLVTEVKNGRDLTETRALIATVSQHLAAKFDKRTK